jgi:capsular exopolysaccharide synthesis family protein
MSKVYEALRQKEHERSDPSHAHSLAEGVAGTAESVAPLDAELGIGDKVLQAAFSALEEEQKPGHGPVAQFHSSSNERARQSRVTPDGFRRLPLSHREDSRLTVYSAPHGLAAEQFRFLRRTLEQKFPNGGVLLITSPAPRDGKTLTALNLCTCLAESGRSTLLVEGDIRQPSVHKVIGAAKDGPGIEDALAGTVEPEKVIHFVDQLSLYVAMVATPPPDPSRLISGSGTKRFLAWARENFGWVVIDSPPVLAAADVAQLVTFADAVLLVVRAQSTPRDLTIRAFEMLGDHLYGVVLNEATIESNPYYRYLADYRRKGTASGRRDGTSKAKGKGSSAAGLTDKADQVRTNG